MGYNKDNFKRIREEYATKTFRAQEEADLRRAELYAAIPAVREMDQQLSAFGLRIMQTALNSGNTEAGIAALREENERICRARVELLRKHGYPANYSEPQYECEACKDTGYVGIKMCVCMRQKLTEAGMASSGLSGLMHKQSFENFSLEYYKQNPEHSRIMKQIFDYTVRYAKEFTIEKGKPMPKSLLFLGDTGLGKTHLSTAIAREIIARGYDVYYNSAVGMISDFEYLRFGNSVAATEATDTARYTECDLLIIDDLGTEVVNQFTVSCLYHVINTRLNLGKPTIISSNLKASELKTTYNERLSSRFKGEYVVLSFCGVDVRKQKIKQ
ncbi:MAG: ATP-binding protein [Clostridia bacterium]|nr:ATP-binding protein [Clostridia bacterium]